VEARLGRRSQEQERDAHTAAEDQEYEQQAHWERERNGAPGLASQTGGLTRGAPRWALALGRLDC
jgi:hypothetical protein